MRNYAEISYKYCKNAINDTLPHRKASKLEKLTCQRQLDDLSKQDNDDFDFYYDEEAGDHHCFFMENLPHVKGPWRGTLLVLEPHQVMIHHTIFAWKKKENGFRRFTSVYLEIPRKNGKSFSSAGIGLYMAFADGEYGAEVYAGAASEKQAQMVFKPAWLMCNNSSDLKEAFDLSLSGTKKNPTGIYAESDMSSFIPVVGKPGDGAAVSLGICDEFHENPSPDIIDTFRTGTGSRQQAMILIITTAGFDTSYPCYFEHLDAVKVLQGTLVKDNLFAMIFGVNDDSDWADFDSWVMANPNYGVSIHEHVLKESYETAVNSLKDRNALLCKHLNKWMNAGLAWMDMQRWESCKDESLKLEDFEGCECFLGLDLANKIDLCALIICFKTDKDIVCFGKYYLNEEQVNKKENDHYQKYDLGGYLTVTQGAVTDFRVIEDDLKYLDKMFVIKELAYDPHECSLFIGEVRDWAGFECIEYAQGPANISEPMKTLESLIYSNGIAHNGDPILTWNMSNVIKKQARGGGEVKYYYPTKQTYKSKIDGAVALIICLGLLMAYEDDSGAYDKRVAAGEEIIVRSL